LIASTSTKIVQFWDEQIPGSVESGRVTVQSTSIKPGQDRVETNVNWLQDHNFLETQPVKDADIFLLRGVIHNWSTPYAIQILKNLRESAVPGKTRLLLIDLIVQYACTDDTMSDIPGADSIAQKVPEPLLPNLGVRTAYTLDLKCVPCCRAYRVAF
jgi:hypothetical protein